MQPEDLQLKALKHCSDHAQREIGGEIYVEPKDHESEWDDIFLRTIHNQAMVIWQQYGNFKVILNDLNHPVGFIDSGKWKKCSWRPMSYSEVKNLVLHNSFEIHKRLKIKDIGQGENNSLEALLVDPNDKNIRYKVRINPSLKHIISILPADYYDKR